MGKRTQLANTLKTISLLGWHSTSQYLLYQLELRSGYSKIRTLPPDLEKWKTALPKKIKSILPTVSAQEVKTVLGSRCSQRIGIAEELLNGQVILFDELKTHLDLSPHTPLFHWSKIERLKLPQDEDIKYIWEPARFGWVFTLAQAFYLNGDLHYASFLNKMLDEFNRRNPPYLGANWASAQEAGLRIMALSFAQHIFSQSAATPSELLQSIQLSIAINAARIPPTLCYARSQRNNHLLSEAVGLYTAGSLLNGFPSAKRWKQRGWNIFCKGILDQIDENGEYIQHSTNYQRLMLDEAIWFTVIAQNERESLPENVIEKLAQATLYFFNLHDPISGCVSNLGHQDGSNVLPLVVEDHLDCRSTLQAAGRLFLKKDLFPAGSWDEKSCWLGIKPQEKVEQLAAYPLRLGDADNWATMRIAQYHSRPAHADQLHVEIWHKGKNLALDAGTYAYNGKLPWCNALRTTRVHNTLTIDGLDQMLPTSRFMWLDWANAELLSLSSSQIVACHDGYKKFGILHQRALKHVNPFLWEVMDEALFSTAQEHQITLHWLLPDLPFSIQNNTLFFTKPAFTLTITHESRQSALLQIIRAGRWLYGSSPADASIYGWFSPTYGVKEPALSILYSVHSTTSLALHSSWKFSED